MLQLSWRPADSPVASLMESAVIAATPLLPDQLAQFSATEGMTLRKAACQLGPCLLNGGSFLLIITRQLCSTAWGAQHTNDEEGVGFGGDKLARHVQILYSRQLKDWMPD